MNIYVTEPIMMADGQCVRSQRSLQFQFPDPLSKVASSRSTRYRIRKKRRQEGDDADGSTARRK